MFEELRELGCSIEGEKKQINLAKDIVKEYVLVGKKVFRNDDLSVTSEEPFSTIKDLPKFINQHLDQLEEKGLLIWDDDMKRDCVSIKIGADHGKNHLKFTLQVMNTACPNSKQNTIVIAMASVKDTYEKHIKFDFFVKRWAAKPFYLRKLSKLNFWDQKTVI